MDPPNPVEAIKFRMVQQGLSRKDLEPIVAPKATFYKHLKFAGVPTVTLSEREVSELYVGLKGTMSVAFPQGPRRQDASRHSCRVEEGNSGGGLCYGYNVVTLYGELGQLLSTGLSVSVVAGAEFGHCFVSPDVGHLKFGRTGLRPAFRPPCQEFRSER